MEDLRCILASDENSVTVEPGVTVGEVTDFLLAKGQILDCTLEMEEATLGGLAMATGMTTHSHVCGLIHDTVLQYDIVTANGELVQATKSNEHSELFYALPWSHGTLGLLVALKLRTVPAKPYVRLSYHHVSKKGNSAASMQVQ
jgi:delta24-sterol reductase